MIKTKSYLEKEAKFVARCSLFELNETGVESDRDESSMVWTILSQLNLRRKVYCKNRTV